jgi:pSer/pThr/pTyr-binding forkhead associated (FHA) protein
MIYCTNCGHPNPDGSNFCSQCGTPLEKSARPAAQQAQPEAEAMRSGDTTRTMPGVPEEREASDLSVDDEAAVSALPAGSALLIVRRGADAGSRFLLDTESTTVGRSQDADILLDDISVSRRHAVFNRTSSGVVVKDVGSLNGTYVNRQMVDEKLLQPGDEVQIGKFRLVFYAARG